MPLENKQRVRKSKSREEMGDSSVGISIVLISGLWLRKIAGGDFEKLSNEGGNRVIENGFLRLRLIGVKILLNLLR